MYSKVHFGWSLLASLCLVLTVWCNSIYDIIQKWKENWQKWWEEAPMFKRRSRHKAKFLRYPMTMRKYSTYIQMTLMVQIFKGCPTLVWNTWNMHVIAILATVRSFPLNPLPVAQWSSLRRTEVNELSTARFWVVAQRKRGCLQSHILLTSQAADLLGMTCNLFP